MPRILRSRLLSPDGHYVASTTHNKATKAAKNKPKKRATKITKKPISKKPAKAIPKRRPPRPHKAAIPPPEALLKDAGIEAPPYLPPKNPRATLLGLPAELRLQIYSHLNATTLIHVHEHGTFEGPKTFIKRYKWTPCKGAHLSYPLLCANPKWSGLCAEADRCTVKKDAPFAPHGFYALAATSKFVRAECMEFSLTESVVSVKMMDVVPWIRWLQAKAPRQLASIRRLTLAGYTDFANFMYNMPKVQTAFPHIEALGIQVQTPNSLWVTDWVSGDVNTTRWREWEPAAWAAGSKFYGEWEEKPCGIYGRHVTFVLEGMIWVKGLSGNVIGGESRYVQEQQSVVRIIREGKVEGDGDEYMGGTGWTDEDVRVEVLQPGGVVEPKRNAFWREWWREGY